MNETAYKNNLKIIEDFLRYKQTAENLSQRRLEKYNYILRNLAKWLNKGFREVDIENIRDLVLKIQKAGYKEATVCDYKLFLKVFYRWLYPNDNDEKAYPKIVSWIKIKHSNGNDKLPEELLSQEDVKRLIEVADVQDRAFVSLLYESGMRSGEIRFLQIKHIKFNDVGAVITIPKGKTGARRIIIYDSVPYLVDYINGRRKNIEEYLFIDKQTKTNKPLSSEALIKKVKLLGERANLQKKIYVHLFRHSRASHLAKLIPEQTLKNYFGWTKNSRMASVYVHLSGRDMDSTMLNKVYGIKTNEDGEAQKEDLLKPKICVYCNAENSSTNSFCSKCNKPIDQTARILFEEKRELAYNKLQLIYEKKPEIIDLLVKALLDIEEVNKN